MLLTSCKPETRDMFSVCLAKGATKTCMDSLPVKRAFAPISFSFDIYPIFLHHFLFFILFFIINLGKSISCHVLVIFPLL